MYSTHADYTGQYTPNEPAPSKEILVSVNRILVFLHQSLKIAALQIVKLTRCSLKSDCVNLVVPAIMVNLNGNYPYYPNYRLFFS